MAFPYQGPRLSKRKLYGSLDRPRACRRIHRGHSTFKLCSFLVSEAALLYATSSVENEYSPESKNDFVWAARVYQPVVTQSYFSELGGFLSGLVLEENPFPATRFPIPVLGFDAPI
jgi:hypothetical protein